MKFPKLHKIVGGPTAKENIQYAIIDKGNIVATNAHVMVVLPLNIYPDIEGAEFAEGKALHRDTLALIASSKVHSIEFTADKILMFTKNKQIISISHYDGVSFAPLKYNMRNPFTGEDRGHTFVFPNYIQVIPDDMEGSKAYDNMAIDPQLLLDITECFLQNVRTGKKEVKIDYRGHGNQTHPHPMQAISVTPNSKENTGEYAIIMPCVPQKN